jgi:hypothetical protein
MNRRAFFVTLSTAAATGATAGCFDSGGGDDGTDGNGDDGTGPPPGQSDLDAAISTLVDVATQLDELASPDTERTQDDVDDLRDQLDSATESLDGAESASPEELSAQISAARTVLDFQRSLVDGHEDGIEMEQALVEQAPSDQFPDSVDGEGIPFDVGRESLLDVVEDLQAGLDAVEQRQTRHGEIETAHGNVDSGPLDADELDYGGDLSQYVRYGRTALADLVSYVELHITVFDGFAEMLLGASQFQDEAWNDAVDSFGSARDTLQGAATDEPPESEIAQQLDLGTAGYIESSALVSQASDLGDRADELAGIAETARDGNVEQAQQQFEELLPSTQNS